MKNFPAWSYHHTRTVFYTASFRIFAKTFSNFPLAKVNVFFHEVFIIANAKHYCASCFSSELTVFLLLFLHKDSGSEPVYFFSLPHIGQKISHVLAGFFHQRLGTHKLPINQKHVQKNSSLLFWKYVFLTSFL